MASGDGQDVTYTSNNPEIQRLKEELEQVYNVVRIEALLCKKAENERDIAQALLREAEPILELRGYPSLSRRIQETLA